MMTSTPPAGTSPQWKERREDAWQPSQDSASQRVAEEVLGRGSAAVPAEHSLRGRTTQTERQKDTASPKETECSIGYALTYVRGTFMEILQKVSDVVRTYFPCFNKESDKPSIETRLAQIEKDLETKDLFYQMLEERVVNLEDNLHEWLKFLKNNMPAPVDDAGLEVPEGLHSEFSALVRYINEKIDAATQLVNDYEVNITEQVNGVRKAVNCIRKMQEILKFLQEKQNPPEQKKEILQEIFKIIKETDADLGSYIRGLYIDESPTLIQIMLLEAYDAMLQAYFRDRIDLIVEVKELLLMRVSEVEENVEEY